MSFGQDSNVTDLNPAGRVLRRAFIGWQCRVRQMSVRRAGGRPSDGMRPWVSIPPADEPRQRIVVLIRKRRSREVTRQLQHMVRRTRDPAERQRSAVEFLAAAYYQQPDTFDDELTALFGPRNTIVEELLEAGDCHLLFEQAAESHRLAVGVAELARSDEAFQFTFWHNSLFNPMLPGDVRILAFRPDWTRSR